MFPGTDSKLELRLNKIQYLNKDAENVASKSVPLAADVIEFAILGSLSNDDGDGNENDKKTIGLLRKTTTLHVRHALSFCTFLCRCCTTTT